MTPEERLSQIEALFETAAGYTVRYEEAINRHEEASTQCIWQYLSSQSGNGRSSN